jgi:hypothetical protein
MKRAPLTLWLRAPNHLSFGRQHHALSGGACFPVYLAFEVGPDLHSFFVHRLGHGRTGETPISPKQSGPIKIKFHLAFLSQAKVIRM